MPKTNSKQQKYTDIVGVDIRDNVVHVLGFRTVRGVRQVRSSGSAPIPAGAVTSGVIMDTDVVGGAIVTACRAAKPHAIAPGTPVACALPESKTFVRILTIPRMEAEKIGEAIKWEIESYIPMSVDDVVYDWRIVESPTANQTESTSILVIAVARTVVNAYVEVFARAQLSLVAMEAEAIAQIRTLSSTIYTTDGMMMVFIGTHSTRITAVYQGVPLLTASVMVGRATLAADVARTLKVSDDEAVSMIEVDGIGSYISRDPIFRAMAPGLKMIATEVTRNAQFCRTSLPICPVIDTMTVVGTGATIKGIRSYLVTQSRLAITRVHPWQAANLDPHKLPPISRTHSMDMMTLIGSALNTVTYEDLY